LAGAARRLAAAGRAQAALAAAQGIDMPRLRGATLADLAPSLPDDLLETALRQARGLADAWARSAALAGLLPHLPPPRRAVAVADLLAAARTLEWMSRDLVLRDAARALAAFLAYAVVALPVGLATGFLVWHPRPGPTQALSPLLIYLVTALPEEFLFRGLIQNLLTRWLGPRQALAITSVVFGLAHLPDPRYVLLAAIAGVAYGWVYLRTGKITASAITHALVDTAWGVLLGG
jgi:membrane protease YdiL (CAAX protease family)